MEGWWKDGRRVCEDRARILKQNSQYQVKLSQLSQFGGSQAKVRWSDVMGSGEGLIIFYILYFTGYFGRQVHISTIYVGLQIKIGGGYEATEKMAKIHLKK